VAIADAAKATNAELNPGYEIEIVVQALGAGSFRAQIKAIYKSARNLFSDNVAKVIVLGVIANYIYERTLSRDTAVHVHISSDEVIVHRGNDRVVVPRDVYDATRRVEKQPAFLGAVSTLATTVMRDEDVTGIGFVPDLNSPPPDILITKADLADIGGMPREDGEDRLIEEESDLQIVKAILERGRRKWEFVWRGVKISAPVLDQAFYERFFAHEITIAPGDSLRVRLAMKQQRDPDTGVFTTWEYEVREVLEHVPRVRQMPLSAADDSDTDSD
jgi:hypothetical protein